jgi:hypothetical protein
LQHWPEHFMRRCIDTYTHGIADCHCGNEQFFTVFSVCTAQWRNRFQSNKRRPFTSSTAVYSSCLTQTPLQLFKRICVGCCQITVPVSVTVPLPVPLPVAVNSNGTNTSISTSTSTSVITNKITGTSTSNTLLQVTRNSSMSHCQYLAPIRSQWSVAVHCCL